MFHFILVSFNLNSLVQLVATTLANAAHSNVKRLIEQP